MAHKNKVIKWDGEGIPFDENDITGTERTGKFSKIHQEEMTANRLLKKSTGLCEEVIPNEIAVYYLMKLEQLIDMSLGEDRTKETAMGGRKREDPSQKVRCNYLFPKAVEDALKRHMYKTAAPEDALFDPKRRYETLDAINTLKFRETRFVMRNYCLPDRENVVGISLEELLARKGKEQLKDKPGFVPEEGNVRLSDDVTSRPFLLRKGRLPFAEALGIFYLAARKNQFYHKLGIAHDDVTTDNTTVYFMLEQTVTRQGFANITTTIARIVDTDFIDWGLARLTKGLDKAGAIVVPELNELLNGGMPIMTRKSEGYYGGGGSNSDIPMRGAESAGLEMLVGDENGKKTAKVDERHDIFSLGNLLVRMLTGYHATFLSGDFIRAHIREYELLKEKKGIDESERIAEMDMAKKRIKEGLGLLESWAYFNSGKREASENPSDKSHETWKTVNGYAKNEKWDDLKAWLVRIKNGSYRDVLKTKLKAAQGSMPDTVADRLANLMFKATADFPDRYDSLNAMLNDLNVLEAKSDVRSYSLPITLVNPNITSSDVIEPDVTDLSKYKLRESGLRAIDTAGVNDAIAAAKVKYGPKEPEKKEKEDEDKAVPLPVPLPKGLSERTKTALGIGASALALAAMGISGYLIDNYLGYNADKGTALETSVVIAEKSTEKAGAKDDVEANTAESKVKADTTTPPMSASAPDDMSGSLQNPDFRRRFNSVRTKYGHYTAHDLSSDYIADPGFDIDEGELKSCKDCVVGLAKDDGSVVIFFDAEGKAVGYQYKNARFIRYENKKGVEALEIEYAYNSTIRPTTETELTSGGFFSKVFDKTLDALLDSYRTKKVETVESVDVIISKEAIAQKDAAASAGGPNAIPPIKEPQKEVPLCRLIKRNFPNQHVTDRLNVTVDYLSRNCTEEQLNAADISVYAEEEMNSVGNLRAVIDVQYDASERRITVKPRFAGGKPFLGRASFNVTIDKESHEYFVTFENKPPVAVNKGKYIEFDEDGSASISLGTFFKDEDGKPLRYTIVEVGGGVTKDMIDARISDDGQRLVVRSKKLDAYTPKPGDEFVNDEMASIKIRAFDLNNEAFNEIGAAINPVNDCPRVVGAIDDILYIPLSSKGNVVIKRLFIDPESGTNLKITSLDTRVETTRKDAEAGTLFIVDKKAPVDTAFNVEISALDRTEGICQREEGSMTDKAFAAISHVKVQFHSTKYISLGKYTIEYTVINMYSSGGMGGLVAMGSCTGYSKEMKLGEGAKSELEHLARSAETSSGDVQYNLSGYIVFKNEGKEDRAKVSNQVFIRNKGNVNDNTAGATLEDKPILGGKEYTEDNTQILLEGILTSEILQPGTICVQVNVYKTNKGNK